MRYNKQYSVVKSEMLVQSHVPLGFPLSPQGQDEPNWIPTSSLFFYDLFLYENVRRRIKALGMDNTSEYWSSRCNLHIGSQSSSKWFEKLEERGAIGWGERPWGKETWDSALIYLNHYKRKEILFFLLSRRLFHRGPFLLLRSGTNKAGDGRMGTSTRSCWLGTTHRKNNQ